jgi:hypothetical protein
MYFTYKIVSNVHYLNENTPNNHDSLLSETTMLAWWKSARRRDSAYYPVISLVLNVAELGVLS